MRPLIVMIMLFWAAPLGAQAVAVTALYEAQVNVGSQDEAERVTALREALRQVVLKVVGNRPALADISLEPLLKEAPRLVQQFRYQRAEEDEGEALTLWVRFDPSSVDRALRQQALPVWGKVRPTLLLWVVVEESSGRRHLLDASTVSPAAEILKERAWARGVPIIFPLWDLADQAQLDVTDIWGNFSDSIRAASERYPAAVQLVGRLLRQAGDWQARWTLYGMSEAHSWTVYGALEPVLRAGVDEAADIIATRVAPLAAADSGFSIRVKVTDVTSYMDYARLSSYLNNLSQVLALQPVQLSRTEVLFELEVQGDTDGLKDSILLGRILAPLEAVGGAEGEALDGQLNYRLLP